MRTSGRGDTVSQRSDIRQCPLRAEQLGTARRRRPCPTFTSARCGRSAPVLADQEGAHACSPMKVRRYIIFYPRRRKPQHLVGLVGEQGYADAVFLLDFSGPRLIVGDPTERRPPRRSGIARSFETSGFRVQPGIGLGSKSEQLAALDAARTGCRRRHAELECGGLAPLGRGVHVGMRLPFVPISGLNKPKHDAGLARFDGCARGVRRAKGAGSRRRVAMTVRRNRWSRGRHVGHRRFNKPI